MKENKYDDPVFFEKYSDMGRSRKGLEGAGEWGTLKEMLPDFAGKRVLDLGCGFGWHCRYAVSQGALSAVGIDLSRSMLEVAREKNSGENITYLCQPMEELDFPSDSFDCVISSLALHYTPSFAELLERISTCLVRGGDFVFSVEHPVFTAYGSQDWIYDDKGNIAHFPVDNYFLEGAREAVFLGERVIKYHRTLTTYLEGLLEGGFAVTAVREPQPTPQMAEEDPSMRDELRRPMMLLVACKKL